MKDNIRNIGLVVGAGLAILGGFRFFNGLSNDKKINHKPAYEMTSHATGWFSGHTEYTRYADGSQDVEEYPARGYFSTFYQDLNGDGLVDRIRKNGTGMFRRPAELLIRAQDYQTHKKEFDEADKKLRELASK